MLRWSKGAQPRELRTQPLTSILLVSVATVVVGGQDLEDLRPVAFPEGKPFNFVVPERLEVPKQFRLDGTFQSGPMCGPNALYSLLVLSGRNVRYEDVVAKVPLGSRGASLESLKDAAADFGIAMEARKQVAPEDLRRAPKPVLVHLNAPPNNDNPDGVDHYVVISGDREAGWFSGIDTTNLVYTSFDPAYLARNMSGYCLIRTQAGNVARGRETPALTVYWLKIVLIVAVLANVVFCFIEFLGRRRLQASKPIGRNGQQ